MQNDQLSYNVQRYSVNKNALQSVGLVDRYELGVTVVQYTRLLNVRSPNKIAFTCFLVRCNYCGKKTRALILGET